MKEANIRKNSQQNIPHNQIDDDINQSQKKIKEINIRDEQPQKSVEGNAAKGKEISNIFISKKANQEKDIENESQNSSKKYDVRRQSQFSHQDQELKENTNGNGSQKQIEREEEEEEDTEERKIAKFYELENDQNMDKVYIYSIVYTFDILMKIFACDQFSTNQMGNYVAAQVMFILLERIAKIILFSTLEIPSLLVWNVVFLDYFALYRYESQRKLKRNYNLYTTIVKRIDIVIASKLIESTILSGPSFLITLSAIVNGNGDRMNTSYVLSAASSLATIIMANKEILDFQLVQCKFNSLSEKLRLRFHQTYANFFKDLLTILINVAAQAGLWMLCTQIDSFITLHVFLSFLYITAITFVITYKSISREKKQATQNKMQLDVRTVAAILGLFMSIFLFVLFYCIFFFLKIKKKLYTFLQENSTKQSEQHQNDIDLIEMQSEEYKLIKPPPDILIYYNYNFYQFQLVFKGLQAYRLYCIFSTIGMIILDAQNDDLSGKFILIRVISYMCSIILFFHLFQMKRDFNLFRLIKQEKILQNKLTKLLRKSKIPYNQLNEIRQQKNILPDNILNKDSSSQSSSYRSEGRQSKSIKNNEADDDQIPTNKFIERNQSEQILQPEPIEEDHHQQINEQKIQIENQNDLSNSQ